LNIGNKANIVLKVYSSMKLRDGWGRGDSRRLLPLVA
jgi:hypothetical protein